MNTLAGFSFISIFFTSILTLVQRKWYLTSIYFVLRHCIWCLAKSIALRFPRAYPKSPIKLFNRIPSLLTSINTIYFTSMVDKFDFGWRIAFQLTREPQLWTRNGPFRIQVHSKIRVRESFQSCESPLKRIPMSSVTFRYLKIYFTACQYFFSGLLTYLFTGLTTLTTFGPVHIITYIRLPLH